MAYTKVFAGNLSFRTKEDQLAEHFAVAGKVVSANIITRGPRSLGYGFVEFETEEQAVSAVALLNKKNIDGRDINVEVAKPREEKPQQQQQQQQQANFDQPRRGRGGPRRRRGGYSQAPSNNNNGQDNQPANSSEAQPPSSGEQAPRAARPKRAPRYNNREGQQSPAQGQPQQQQQQGQGQEGEATPQSGEYVPRGRGRGRGGRGRGGRGRGGRGRRGFYNGSRAPRPQSVESTTSLFVANLPFELDDAKLLELFKDHKAVSAHVVTNYQGRSRGFGFVEFDEKDQKAAFEATNQNKIVSNERPLTVKIALIEEKQTPSEAPEGDASAQPTQAAQPAQQN